jgi:hypothetical protein
MAPFPAAARDLSLLQSDQTDFVAHSVQWVPVAALSEVKRSGREAHHSRLSSVEVMPSWHVQLQLYFTLLYFTLLYFIYYCTF